MQEYVRRFTDDGFIIIGNLFADRELAELRAALTKVEHTVNADPQAYETRFTSATESIVDTWGVNHVFSPELYDEAFSRVFDNVRVMDFVQAVLGKRLRFWGGHALWAPRLVDYELNWHRDYGDHDAFQPAGKTTHVQFNVCLLADACFMAVPGSHRRPLTPQESEQQSTKGMTALPGEVVARCRPGDVLFMNAHALHRGSCSVGTARQTLHISLQPFGEPTGGHVSWRFMRNEGYLEGLPTAARELMRNAVEWDDAHPLSMAEMRRRMRISRDIKSHRATDGGRSDTQ